MAASSFPRLHLISIRSALRRSAGGGLRPASSAHRHFSAGCPPQSTSLNLTPNASAMHLHLHLPSASSASMRRFYSSDSSEKPRSLPTVMEFQNIIWPSVFKTVRNWIMVNFIIRPYFDQEFNVGDFVLGSKQAVELVSERLAALDVHSLQGLVASEAIDELRATTARMTLTQRQEIAINKDDIYLSFPYQVGIIFDDDEEEGAERRSGGGEVTTSAAQKQKRWVEITMVFHVLRGLKEMQENGIVPPLNIGMHPEYRNRISICNYRFIKEFTQGNESDWTINVANHFKPADDLDDE